MSGIGRRRGPGAQPIKPILHERRALKLPESQSHCAPVDAVTSTTPYFRLIAVNLNH